MADLNLIIAKNLARLRKELKLTQLELAEKLNYSDKAVSKWENGESTPSVDVLKKLSEIYGVSVDYLMTEDHTKDKEQFKQKLTKRKIIIVLLSVITVWFCASLIYLSFRIFAGLNLWILFCWAVPASMIITVIFDAVWNRHRFLFWFVSILFWSLLICITVQFFRLNYDIWQILFIGIPLQIATFLWVKLLK